MKTTKRYLVKSEKIHSLKEIEMEKQRLRLEILKTEANIHAEYHSILNALTFKNIASNVIGNISPASTIISSPQAMKKCRGVALREAGLFQYPPETWVSGECKAC